MFGSKRNTKVVASWNCKVNRDNELVVDAVRDIILRHSPDAIMLEECVKYVHDLEDEYDDRYEFVYDPTATFANRRANTVLMVKRSKWLKRSNVLRTMFIRNSTPWVGPEGGDQPGRTYPVAFCRGGWAYFAIHRVTGYLTKNKKASIEETDTLVFNLKLAAVGNTVIAAGDWNSTAMANSERSVKGVARSARFDFLLGSGVDHAIGNGVKATCWQGPTYGSDHHLHVWTVVRNKK